MLSRQRYAGGIGGNARMYLGEGPSMFMTETGMVTPWFDAYNYYNNGFPEGGQGTPMLLVPNAASAFAMPHIDFNRVPDLLHMAGVYASIAGEALQKAYGTRFPLLECWGCKDTSFH
jgi:hypothetical protein